MHALQIEIADIPLNVTSGYSKCFVAQTVYPIENPFSSMD
jgi:hypothetical protein